MMTRQARVLVVEDDSRWREELSDMLQGEGFLVDTAATTSSALNFLADNFYHLLVLDVRMVDFNLDDEDGMILLRQMHKDGLTEITRVIILSARATLERMRKAFAQYHVADFQQKQSFDNLEFLADAHRLIGEMQLRLDLKIDWNPQDAAEQLISNLKLGIRQVAADAARMRRQVEELEELLCRLFCNANSVIVEPLTPGWSDAKVLKVEPFFAHGLGRPVVVKFGDPAKITEEKENFTKYIENYIGGRRSTVLQKMDRTPHLGGIIYSLLDAIDDKMRDFGDYYATSDIQQIQQVVQQLFFDTCKGWYINIGMREPCDLLQEYQHSLNFTPERIEHVVTEQLSGVESTDVLRFKSLSVDRSFRNPVLALDSLHAVRPVIRGITHGDFNQHNILVESNGHVWLIDFLRSGMSHYLRDVVHLDSVVRFQLLAAGEATLDERLALEELLAATENLDDEQRQQAGATLNNTAVVKAFAISVYLQSIARQLEQRNAQNVRTEYAAALLYTALNAVKFSFLPSVQREHALLCASLLSDRLHV